MAGHRRWLSLKDLPIQRKLVVIIMMTSLAVVMISTAALIGSKIISFRSDLLEHLSTLTNVIGRNSTAALSFNDPKAAKETLSALKAEPSVQLAATLDQKGQVFSAYGNTSTQGLAAAVANILPKGRLPLTLKSERHRFGSRYLDLLQPIVLDREVIGAVFLRTDLKDLYASLARYLLIAFCVLAAAAVIAYGMSMKFRGIISDPILQLAEISKSVSQNKNYAIRAVKFSNDEIGTLIDGFNEMLSQIQIRDRKLEEHRSRLKEQVAQRTVDLEKTNQHLEEMVAKLAKSKKAAETANQAKSEFLANMSHELRTPLNHIMGFTELVVDQNFGPLNTTQQEYLNDALQSSRHLLSLINDILDLSKVEAGKEKLHLSSVNLQALLENGLTLIREKALHHGIALAFETDGIPENITADERKLRQILYNLLSNAAKFTPDGGKISLSAVHIDAGSMDQAEYARLAPTVQTANGDKIAQALPALTHDYVKISVTDTGIGLKRKDLVRIFDPFDQVESSASRRFQGTGLGLALTRRFVQMHGGALWAESDGEGKGACFCFLIPVKAQIVSTPSNRS